jgi:hypothetical protein
VKKHINLFTVIAILIVLAALAGAWRGIPIPVRTFGDSNGGKHPPFETPFCTVRADGCGRY